MVILVVDDEESICDLIAQALESDHKVIKAFNGQEALALAQAQPFDLVVTDLMMPRMSGLELIRALKANSATPNVPVLLLSASYLAPSEIDLADAFVTKPFDLNHLEQVVTSLLKNPDSGPRKAGQGIAAEDSAPPGPKFPASNPIESCFTPPQNFFAQFTSSRNRF